LPGTKPLLTRPETLVQPGEQALVRKLYEHRDRERALDRVTAAYERSASYTQIRFV
jgi:hypothetical protein